MKTIRLACAALIFLALQGGVGLAAESNPSEARLNIELRDGSRVIGTPVDPFFRFHSALLGDLKLSISDVRSLECGSTNTAKLTTVNGDTLTVSFRDSAFGVKTSFGQVELTVASLRRLTVVLSGKSGLRSALKVSYDNRVEIPNDPQLQFGGGPFTISCWIKTATAQDSAAFISKRASGIGDGWILLLDNGHLLFYCASSCAAKSSQINVGDGQWHHVLMTREGSEITFYLDGQAVGADRDAGQHYDNNPIRIGMDGPNGTPNFAGEIAEVHLYNRALSAAEVAEEWNNGQGITAAVSGGGLVAGYHFDEAAGQATKDFSGHHHDGILNDKPGWEN
jgi:hypothetical protein